MPGRCVVPGCPTKSPKYAFPSNLECRNIWLKRIAAPDLTEGKLRKAFICYRHFDPICISSAGRMYKTALPSLYLPSYQKVENDEFMSMDDVKSTPRILKNMPVEVIERGSSEVFKNSTDCVVKLPTKVYGKGTRVTSKEHPIKGESVDIDLSDDHDMHFIEEQQTVFVKEGETVFIKEDSPVLDVSDGDFKMHATTEPVKENDGELPDVTCEGLSSTSEVNEVEVQSSSALEVVVESPSQQISRKRDSAFDAEFQTPVKFSHTEIPERQLPSTNESSTEEDESKLLHEFLVNSTLPSIKCVTNILGKIPIDCGINEHLFEYIRVVVRGFDDLNKLCILMFGEIPLDTRLSYNPSRDLIEGIVDSGGCRSSGRKIAFANRALVFMIKGIYTKWKQPLCYYFVKDDIDLIKIIKELVTNIHKTGLRVIASVCDDSETNIAAIKTLFAETEAYCIRHHMQNEFRGYVVQGAEIVHLYNVPHLLMGIRDMMLTKDLHFSQEGVERVASWSHILDSYKREVEAGTYRLYSKLTDEHVIPEKIKRTKPKYCLQVFSQTVASALNLRAFYSSHMPVSSSSSYLDPSGEDTATLLLFLDKLFDSLSGGSSRPPKDKPLRGPVTVRTDHLETWKDALSVLRSMYFRSLSASESEEMEGSRSIENLIFTIESFIYLWNVLQKSGLRRMTPIDFSQLTVINFFDRARQDANAENPTCASFASSFQSLVVNTWKSNRCIATLYSNDDSFEYYDTLRKLVAWKVKSNKQISEVRTTFKKFEMSKNFFIVELAAIVAVELIEETKCERCRVGLTTGSIKRGLIYPSEKYRLLFRRLTDACFKKLPKILNTHKVKWKMWESVGVSSIQSLFCDLHKRDAYTLVDKALQQIIWCYTETINGLSRESDSSLEALCETAFRRFLKKWR